MPADLSNTIAELEALAAEALKMQEQAAQTATRFFFAAQRLTQELRQVIAKQQALTGENRYTEREAAEKLRVSVDVLRGLRRRQFARDPARWPHYTLEGVVGFFYTDAHLGEIASRRYLGEVKAGRCPIKKPRSKSITAGHKALHKMS